MGFSSFFFPLPFFAPIGIRPIVSLMSKKSALRGEGGRAARRGEDKRYIRGKGRRGRGGRL